MVGGVTRATNPFVMGGRKRKSWGPAEHGKVNASAAPLTRALPSVTTASVGRPVQRIRARFWASVLGLRPGETSAMSRRMATGAGGVEALTHSLTWWSLAIHRWTT